MEALGLALEEDEERAGGAVMTTLKNLARRAREGPSEDEASEATGVSEE
jgi:hypothetical protein